MPDDTEARDANGKWTAGAFDMKAVNYKTSNVHTLSKDEQELSDLEDAGMIHTQEMGDDGQMHDIDFANSPD
jgi:hypothetical protein